MNYEALENQISDRIKIPLKQAVPKIEIVLEPEFEGDNKRVAENPLVNIFLDEETFSKVKTSGYVSQDGDIKVFLLVRSRTLRGEGGIYHIIEHIRAALVGFIPKNFTRMYMVTVKYDGHERGVWTYAVVVGCGGTIVEDHTPPTAPKLKTATADFSDNEFNN